MRARCGRLARVAALPICLTVAVSLAPAGARALEIPPGKTTLSLLNSAGEPESRAGAHPDRLVQGFEFVQTGKGAEDPKDMVIDLPAGLGGNPSAVPVCPHRVFGDIPFGEDACPPESQVGRLISSGGETTRIYSIEPGPQEATLFGGVQFIFPMKFSGHLRPQDEGLSLRLGDMVQGGFGAAFKSGELELWGIPADHQEGTSIPRKPLLTLPSECGPPLAVTVSTHTWQEPSLWISASGDTGEPVVGCEQLSFDPRLAFTLDNPTADAPTGARIELTVPQDENPDGLATSTVKDVSVAMPKGTTLSLGGAASLTTCTDAQLGLRMAVDAHCPLSSRVGTVELEAQGTGASKSGSLYLGQEHPGDRFRLFVVANVGGSELKLVGSLLADRATGQLTAKLDGLPQLGFERLGLRFDGGPGALLASPLSCGSAPTGATFTPYSGTAPVQWNGAVAVAAPSGASCGAQVPFQPTFTAGSTDVRAGHATSFTATVRRRDGEQLPRHLTVAFPPGLSAALGKIDVCSAAAAADGSCAPASSIGTAVAELGPGSNPARINGDIYLTGPYRGAPFGLDLAFKAAIGPFDLGTIVVRAAMRVDPLTGQVSAQTDPLPTLFEGIPVRFQMLGLDLDRPGFMHNPTHCGASSVGGALRSASGEQRAVASPFAIRGCVTLPFRPKFSVELTNREQMRKDGRPGLRLSARARAGDANLSRADVSLPGLLKFDVNGLRAICARPEAVDGNCPKGSRVGSGYARTPLLKGPMKGSIYAVQPPGSGLPELWTSVSGDGIQVRIRGRTTVRHGHAETSLVGIPDFPLKSFTMQLASGRHGLLQLKRRPCRGLAAPVEVLGQNGASENSRLHVLVPSECGRDG
jgi:hypothetical protein